MANGGFIFQAFGADAAIPKTVTFINKKISNTVLTLYNPNGIIGRGMAISRAGSAQSLLCGEIVLV